MTWQSRVLLVSFQKSILNPLNHTGNAVLYTGLWHLIELGVGWEIRTMLGGARTHLPLSKTGEMGWQEEPGVTSCPMFYLFSRSPTVEWTLLSLTPAGGIIVKNWTQASLGCCTCEQWSHRVQLSSSILPGPDDFMETRSLSDVPWHIYPTREDSYWSRERKTKLSFQDCPTEILIQKKNMKLT